jgi:hypothetical protein
VIRGAGRASRRAIQVHPKTVRRRAARLDESRICLLDVARGSDPRTLVFLVSIDPYLVRSRFIGDICGNDMKQEAHNARFRAAGGSSFSPGGFGALRLAFVWLNREASILLIRSVLLS